MTWVQWAAERGEDIRALGRWLAPRDLDALGPVG